MVELASKKVNDIKASELRDGQLAVITKWGMYSRYVGRIVQRLPNSLVLVGVPYVSLYGTVPSSENYRVRVLEEGEMLVVRDNA